MHHRAVDFLKHIALGPLLAFVFCRGDAGKLAVRILDFGYPIPMPGTTQIHCSRLPGPFGCQWAPCCPRARAAAVPLLDFPEFAAGPDVGLRIDLVVAGPVRRRSGLSFSAQITS